jgi:hypothetical protein
MSENNTNKDVRDDEVDLLDLFRRMGRSIGRMARALGRGFLISAVFLLKRWLPLGLSIILGVGASYLTKVTSDSSYTSDLVLRNNQVSNSDMISYLNRLHVYCKEKNSSALQEAISLGPKQTSNIIDISSYWIIDNMRDGIPDFVDYKNSHNVYDTINSRMQDRLDVRVKVKTPQELGLVMHGIISFIDKDSLFQQRNRLRLRQNLDMLKRFDYDIQQLDSLQKIKYFEETKIRQPQGGGQMIFLQEQKTQLIYPEIQTLYTMKQTLEAERDLYNGIVTVLSEFTIPARRINGTLYYGLTFIPLFFCLTLLVLIIIANRKKLEEIYNTY